MLAAAKAGQRAAEQLMTETCTITRENGETATFIAATGQYTDTTATVYAGKCRIRPRSAFLRERIAEAGEQAQFLWPYIVAVPVSVTDVQVGDIITVTASGDASLVDRQLRVRIAARGENVTARRLDCEELAP
jgi:hypothetical protein